MTGQKGQAIVLVGLMLTVLVGMTAIAVDGSRAYALRRDLQAAADAGALAAGDKLQQTGSWLSAEQAAANVFGANMRLYGSPPCSLWGSPGATSWTVTCNYSDSTQLTEVASTLGPQGAQFALTASRPLQLDFAGILTNGSLPTIATAATSVVGNQRDAPAITALDQAGCGGTSGSAVAVNGGGTLTVIGDLVSAGAVSVSAGAIKMAGDLYARCQASPPGGVTMACYSSAAGTPCSPPDVAGAVRAGFRPADPNYPLPVVTGGSQGAPSADVVLQPGLYAADPNFSTSRCYFLSAGVYEWQGGYTNAGGFISNELKPPDEPVSGNNTSLGHQMWDTGGVNCAGSYQLSSPSGAFDIRQGTWAVEVTATRIDTTAGINYKRESAPSMCRTVGVGNGQVLQVTISNVPGATAYNVYVAPPGNGCGGPFGYAGSILVTASVHNDGTAGCPAFSGTTCSLGYVSGIFDGTVLTGAFAPNSLAAPGVLGAYPPSGETPPLRINLPNQNPDRGTPPAGDRANENQCSTVVGAATSCPGSITPGAVEFYIPSTGCLNATTSGDNFLFSGYQFDWILVYQPGAGHPPVSYCSNLLGAAADSAWVGLIYTPTASLTISKAATFRTEATGGLMADTISFIGQLPTIIYSPNYAPQPPASRLSY